MNIDKWLKFKNKFLFKPHKRTKVGLALGGGAARGFAHIGAIKAFEEYGLKFDVIAGTSVGSLVAALYSSGKNFQELYDIAKDIKMKDIRTSKIFFIPSKTEGLENVLISQLGDVNIETLPKKLAIVACDLKTTKECCLTHGNLAKAVAGSCAVPGVFHPVEFEDLLLVDGGLQNNVPASIPKMLGCDYVVAIDVNPARGQGTDSSKMLDVLSCTIGIFMKGTTLKGYLNADIMLKPDTKRFKSMRVDNFEEMIQEGYQEAIDKMPSILKLFGYGPLRKKHKAKFFDEQILIK